MNLNLVVDASGMFYRSLFTVGTFGGAKNERLLDSKASQGVFMRKLATDLSSLVRSIEDPARVIVCLDSSSWRKTVEIEEGGYKLGREEKKDKTQVNWNAFYELTEKFSNILSNKGYVLSKVPGAEADDLLYFWSRKFNVNKQNAVLITGDRDLLQTLNLSENGAWTIALDPILNRKKISLTQETLDYKPLTEEEVNIFDSSSWNTSESILQKLINTHEINVVDTKKLSTMKVILGDGGDSVPSVVTWKDKKDPSKIRTMTENNYSKIVAAHPSILEASWEDLCRGEFVEEISSTMEELKKIEVDREVVKRNLQRNAKLVILSDKTIPSQVRDGFLKAHVSVPATFPVTSRDSLLNGTEWWTNDKTSFVPKSFDLFGE